jgi:protein phosphatase 1B
MISSEHLIVANVGDSRAVLCRNGSAVAMSEDHKPYNEIESARITAAGGYVSMRRVNGDLAVSRAVGDFCYKEVTHLPAAKQKVSVEPEIKIEARQPGDEFLILACDGIWDVMSNEVAVAFVKEQLAMECDIGLVCENMIMECLGMGSRDNMSVIIITFAGATISETHAPVKSDGCLSSGAAGSDSRK